MLSRRHMLASGAAAFVSGAVVKDLLAQTSRSSGAQAASPAEGYAPVTTPNGVTLPHRMVDGVKVMHLIAEEIEHEFAPGLVARCWGYNGRTPGPTLEAVEGDHLRIYVTNRLPVQTTVHWHGLRLPNGMDGVNGLTQPTIPPGETFVYEFTLRQHGTYMYHPHFDEMTQQGLGMMGMFIIHPKNPTEPRPDRDFAIMLSEWHIEPGAARPDPTVMTDFNVFTMNSKAFPATDALVARLGQRVRIRFGNLSAMDHHPIHLHGYDFHITETDGGVIPAPARYPANTVLVPVGSTRAIDFVADAPGDWAMHCHMTHHVMNQMGHDFPNMVGVDTAGIDEQIRPHLPHYMSMGHTGMGEMALMNMPSPANSIPMMGANGPFGIIDMGGMFTIVKVRDGITGYADPGWFQHPPGTVSRKASDLELQRDLGSIERAPATRPGVSYTCPMHPEVTNTKPGTCPKCGMKLVEKK